MALRYRLTLGFGLLLLIMLTIFWTAMKLQLDRTLLAQQDVYGQTIVREAADSVTELVLANDQLGLNVVASQLNREPGIANVIITDVDGRVLAPPALETNLPASDTPGVYRAAVSIQDAVAGFVIIQLDPVLDSNPFLVPQTMYYLMAGLGLALVFALSWFLSLAITRPLESLAASDPADPETEANFRLSTLPELQQAQLKYLELWNRSIELEEQIASTGLPDPAEEERQAARAERRMATLVAVEVVNSRGLIEFLHPGTLSILLQQYQFYLRQAARLYRGAMIRVEGDLCLLAFDNRHCQDDHARNAVCCAQLFLLLMKEVAASQKQRKAQSLEFRISIHSGDLYFSPLWRKAKDEQDRPREESVIGKPVDLVLELLDHATAGNILVSELSYDLADGQSRFAVPRSGTFAMDEDSLTISGFAIDAATGIHADLLQRQCRHLLPESDGNRN